MEQGGSEVDVSQLVDTLRVRLGNKRVFRLSPVESEIPERSARRVAATSRTDGAIWPQDLPRPARLLSPPEQVQAAFDDAVSWYEAALRLLSARHSGSADQRTKPSRGRSRGYDQRKARQI